MSKVYAPGGREGVLAAPASSSPQRLPSLHPSLAAGETTPAAFAFGAAATLHNEGADPLSALKLAALTGATGSKPAAPLDVFETGTGNRGPIAT